MTNSKDFSSLSKEEHEEIFAKAAKKAVEEHHAAGEQLAILMKEEGIYCIPMDAKNTSQKKKLSTNKSRYWRPRGIDLAYKIIKYQYVLLMIILMIK